MSKDKEKQELSLNDFSLESILGDGTAGFAEQQLDEQLEDKEVEEGEVKDGPDNGNADPIVPPVPKDKTKAKEEVIDPEEAEEGQSFKPLFEVIHESLGIEYKAEEDDYEDSAEGLSKLITDIIDANSKPEFASEEVQRFDEYVRNGGNPAKYVNVMYGTTDYEKVDISKPENQKKVVFDYYKRTTKLTDEQIDRRITKWADLDSLEEEAKDALDDLKKITAEEKASLEADLAKENAAAHKRRTDQVDQLKETILKNDDFDGIPIPKEDKQKFIDYLTKPTKEGITQYAKDLTTDKNAAIKMAYLKFKGFKLDNIEAKVKTDITKKAVKALSRFSATKGKPGGTIAAKADTTQSSDYSEFNLSL